MAFQEDFDKAIKDYSENNMYQVSNVPAHAHTGTDSLRVDFANVANRTRFVLYRIVNPTVDTTVANVVGGDFVMPFAGFVSDVGATVDTAGTTGTTTIDINKNNSTILKTKITIDSTEKTSRTAATPPVINVAVRTFEVGDIFTFDVDAINTTAAKGLTMFMDVTQI